MPRTRGRYPSRARQAATVVNMSAEPKKIYKAPKQKKKNQIVGKVLSFPGSYFNSDVDTYSGKVIRHRQDGQYEVSFHDGRWILPRKDIENFAKKQLNLKPTSVPVKSAPRKRSRGKTTAKGKTPAKKKARKDKKKAIKTASSHFTGYKKMVVEAVESNLKPRKGCSDRAIVAAVVAAKSDANRKLIRKAVNKLFEDGHIKTIRGHSRTYTLVKQVVKKVTNNHKVKSKKSTRTKSSSKHSTLTKKKALAKKKRTKNKKRTKKSRNPPVAAPILQRSPSISYQVNVLASAGLENAAVICDDSKIPFDCELTQIRPEKNMDKFYNFQLIKTSDGKILLHTEWGRTGQNPQSSTKGPFTKAVGIAAFVQQFKNKTGNKWDDRSFAAEKKNKYKYVHRKTAVREIFKWQYYMDPVNQHNERGGWYDYDAQASVIVNHICAQWKDNKDMPLRVVKSNYFEYFVDFERMVQRNTSTGKERPIQQIPL